jgi:Molecular chaperone, HSP90 family
VIDSHWLQQLETRDVGLTFARVDSDTIDRLIDKDEVRESVLSEEQQGKIKALFDGVKGSSGTVQLQALSPDDMPVTITRNEFMRRMTEMQAMQNMGGKMPEFYNVVVNTNHPLVVDKLNQAEGEAQQALARQLLDLARLNQGLLRGKELADFIKRSVSSL